MYSNSSLDSCNPAHSKKQFNCDDKPIETLATPSHEATTIKIVTLIPFESALISQFKTLGAENAPVVAQLAKYQCCARCIFRYLKITDYRFYREDIGVLEKIIDYLIHSFCHVNTETTLPLLTMGSKQEASQSTFDPISHHQTLSLDLQQLPSITTLSNHQTNFMSCPLCLGLLQIFDHPKILEDTLGKIQLHLYQTDQYRLALSLPAAIYLRHYQMWYHLQDLFPNLLLLQSNPINSEIPDPKEVFKWILGRVLLQKYQLKFDFEARFEVRVKVVHDETKLEPLLLRPPSDQRKEAKRPQSKRHPKLSAPLELDMLVTLDHGDVTPNFADPIASNMNGDHSCLSIELSNKQPKLNKQQPFNIVVGNIAKDHKEECSPSSMQNFSLLRHDHQSDNHQHLKKTQRKTPIVDSIGSVIFCLRTMTKQELMRTLSLAKTTTLSAGTQPIEMKKDQPSPIRSICQLEFELHHMSIFIAGRYCKYVRNLPQSPWIIDGVRKGQSSVQELIGSILLPHFSADGYKFMASGREDVDVRMLGRGRPFIVEILNPCCPHLSPQQYQMMQREINQNASGSIFVVDLQEVSEKDIGLLREGEEFKKKSYQCLNWMEKCVDNLQLDQHLEIDQLTPVRVLHRRSLSYRKKIIYNCSMKPLNDHYAILNMTTQAGTYVKEFVNSDLGRTKPSLSDLIMQEVDILLLDVLEVELDFPKRIDKEEPPEPSPITDQLDLSVDLRNIIMNQLGMGVQ